jgi:hypothetical protein
MRGRDGMPTPEEWRKIKAEWMHDHGQRHMDDRGVKYEDQTERKLDHDAARGNTAAGPPHPWPSEFVSQNRHQPGQDQGKSSGDEKANGHDAGHSM